MTDTTDRLSWMRRRARRASMLGMDPKQRSIARRVNQSADALAAKLRGARAEYERYLYQAIGRKVDFEECEVVKGSGTHYTVTVRYIVLKGASEPMAPRFWATVVIAHDPADPDGALRRDLNAGYTNALGMTHSKFTQSSCDVEMLLNPAAVFGWMEYLEGEFLRGKRLVKPFTPHSPDMGTLTASVSRVACGCGGNGLTSKVVDLCRMVAQKRGFPAGALSLLHTSFVLGLVDYLDHLHYYDEATLLREAMVFALQREGDRSRVPYPKLVPALDRLFHATIGLDVALDTDASAVEPAIAEVLVQFAELLCALGEVGAAAKVRRARAMLG